MSKISIEVSEELRQAWPQFRGAAVFATVRNSAYNEDLWKRIGEFTDLYRAKTGEKFVSFNCMDKQNNSQVEVTNSDIKGNSNKMRIILIIIIIFAIICLVV